jgi:hypothetical protein
LAATGLRVFAKLCILDVVAIVIAVTIAETVVVSLYYEAMAQLSEWLSLHRLLTHQIMI